MEGVLITGGAGYIGSQAAKELRSLGYQPIVLDNFSTGRLESVQWGPVIEADAGDKKALSEVLTENQVKAVLHFAAFADVGESMREPGKYLQNNYLTTVALLEAMEKTGVRNLVFSSTCATYGVPRSVPVSESHPQRPISPYGQSKLLAEVAVREFGLRGVLNWVVLRYFNAAGLDPERDYSSQNEPDFRIIPRVLQTAAGLRPALDLYGENHETPDGTAVRDFVHVTDLAKAHALSLEYLLGGGESRAFNLGSGHGYSVREVIESARRVTGRQVPYRGLERRLGDPPALVADIGAAESVLGWKSSYRELDEIVETSWRWYAAGMEPQAAALSQAGNG
ncbi:MAG: UDP-glucose 4-epimerase GalE [Acidimicrobiia bacterium]|nr:UDP-glucose 4-epimerase GalE [Acidimicrobiia bacterium]